MYPLLRNLLFQLSPEHAHHFSMGLTKQLLQIPAAQKWAAQQFSGDFPSLEREYFGLKFKNPIGMAAGFDKDATYFEALSTLGFGFVEIGTVTPRPQVGNPKPRLFRIPGDKALINRMGFNNLGAAAAAQRLKHRKTDMVIGGNIGKNKDTPNEKATDDYLACFHALSDVVDYFAINVSSPNTPNLRALQDKEPLTHLLMAIMEANHKLPKPKPIFLKIAPDLSEGQLDEILEITQATHIQGIIATNTTIARSPIQLSEPQVQAIGAGGLSGKPLKTRATEVIRYLYHNSGEKLFIIGAGGIFTATDAQEKLEAGAKLLQVYTGFVYEGPAMVNKICRDL